MAETIPGVLWKPFSGKSTTPLTHDIICVHTMVGTLAGSWAYANRAGNPYWHFGVNGHGEAWLCHPLQYRSAANLNGNWHIIPIETSDWNEGFWPSSWTDPPWTTAQVQKLIHVIAWLCVRYGIPPVLIPDTKPGRRGLAYHRQGIEPWLVSGGEKWSNATGKSCPASRVHQFIHQVIPGVQALVWGLEEEMPLLDNNDHTGIRNDVRSVLDEGAGVGQINWSGTQKTILAEIQEAENTRNQQHSEKMAAIASLKEDVEHIKGMLHEVPPPTPVQVDASAVVAALEPKLEEIVRNVVDEELDKRSLRTED